MDYAKEPMLPSTTKTQMLRISSCLVGSVSLDAQRVYSFSTFQNGQGEKKVRSELNGLHKNVIRGDPFHRNESKINHKLVEANFMSPEKKKSILGTLMDAPGHQYVNRYHELRAQSEPSLEGKDGRSRIPTPR